MLILNLESKEALHMVTPTFATLMVSGALLVIVLAAQWYLWGAAYTVDFRAPRPLRPLRTAEILDRFLGRVIETNQAMLPVGAIEPARTTAKADEGKEHDGHGFRKVA